jgi:hypothetical protein
MNKTVGGRAMERKEQMQATPAGRVSQQQKPIGGGAVRDLRIVWSTIDAANRYNSFLIIEFTDKADYEEFWSLPSGVEKSVFLSEKLEGKRVFIPDDLGGYELEFPPYFDEYGRKNLFWYNNVYESYRRALKRLTEEWVERLSDYYREDEEEALWEEARERAEEELNGLTVVRI